MRHRTIFDTPIVNTLLRSLSMALLRLGGWKVEGSLPPQAAKSVLIAAPHTSNWDFLIGQLYSRAENIKSNFLMKKEWFFWPLGPIFRKMGGVPVWRSKHTSMTDNLAEEAKKRESFGLCITPEDNS